MQHYQGQLVFGPSLRKVSWVRLSLALSAAVLGGFFLFRVFVRRDLFQDVQWWILFFNLGFPLVACFAFPFVSTIRVDFDRRELLIRRRVFFFPRNDRYDLAAVDVWLEGRTDHNPQPLNLELVDRSKNEQILVLNASTYGFWHEDQLRAIAEAIQCSRPVDSRPSF